MSEAWAWALLVGLGAFHGVNPAMGWLFAVGLGLQNRDRRAVISALAPIAAGHALSLLIILVTFGALRVTLDPSVIRYVVAGLLVAFALFRLVKRFAHPRWVSMRVGPGDLVLWSFLMSSAHGAGLMVLPALQALPVTLAGDRHVAMAGALGSSTTQAVAATGVHTLAMLAVTGLVAVVVFDRVGVGFLRRAWVNLDLLWAAGLLAAAVLAALG